MSEQELDLLGDYFVANDLINKGWTFIQLVNEYKLGYISLEIR